MCLPAAQNTAIFTPTGTSAGVGFAIPIDTVRKGLLCMLCQCEGVDST